MNVEKLKELDESNYVYRYYVEGYGIWGIKMTSKKRRIKKSRKKSDKATKKLIIARYRRKKAEQGDVFGSLFGKPK